MHPVSQLQSLEPTTSDPCMGVYEVPNVEVGEPVGVIEGIGATIDFLELGVWIGARTTSVFVLSDVEVVGTLSGHWSR